MNDRGLGGARAVLFDFGGTLDADGVTWRERVAALYRAEGHGRPDDAFAPVFYKADDALVGAIPTTLSLGETVSRLVEGVASGLGVPERAVVDRVAEKFVAGVVTTLRANGPVLTALARSYRLGIVSNFYGNLAAVCHELGVARWFSVIVDSTDVGYRKPDPRIFGAALTALAVTSGDAVFVGDSQPRDMAGARALGMRHVWLRARTAPEATPCCPGDRVVASVRELPGLFAA